MKIESSTNLILVSTFSSDVVLDMSSVKDWRSDMSDRIVEVSLEPPTKATEEVMIE